MAAVGLKACPPDYLFYLCVFWRLMYNITLADSELSKSHQRPYADGFKCDGKKGRIPLQTIISFGKGSTGSKNLNEKPAEFNAWILNTN